jgi:hypothetical protein
MDYGLNRVMRKSVELGNAASPAMTILPSDCRSIAWGEKQAQDFLISTGVRNPLTPDAQKRGELKQ